MHSLLYSTLLPLAEFVGLAASDSRKRQQARDGHLQFNSKCMFCPNKISLVNTSSLVYMLNFDGAQHAHRLGVLMTCATQFHLYCKVLTYTNLEHTDYAKICILGI